MVSGAERRGEGAAAARTLVSANCHPTGSLHWIGEKVAEILEHSPEGRAPTGCIEPWWCACLRTTQTSRPTTPGTRARTLDGSQRRSFEYKWACESTPTGRTDHLPPRLAPGPAPTLLSPPARSSSRPPPAPAVCTSCFPRWRSGRGRGAPSGGEAKTKSRSLPMALGGCGPACARSQPRYRGIRGFENPGTREVPLARNSGSRGSSNPKSRRSAFPKLTCGA